MPDADTNKPDPGDAGPNDLGTVKTLFAVAHVTMSEDELERFGRTYGALRAQADALYREEFRQEAPALAFDPTTAYA